jgi:hypothetical protein
MQVHAALRREFGVTLSVIDLFQRTTVAAQADLVSRGRPGGAMRTVQHVESSADEMARSRILR